jgi:hypothetical protein
LKLPHQRTKNFTGEPCALLGLGHFDALLKVRSQEHFTVACTISEHLYKITIYIPEKIENHRFRFNNKQTILCKKKV